MLKPLLIWVSREGLCPELAYLRPLDLWMCSLSLSSPKDIFFPLRSKLASPSGVLKKEAVTPLRSKKRLGKGEGWKQPLCHYIQGPPWSGLSAPPVAPSLPLFSSYQLLSFENPELISTSGPLSLLPEMLSLQMLSFSSLAKMSPQTDQFTRPLPAFQSIHHMAMVCCPNTCIPMWHALLSTVVFCPPTLQSKLYEVGILSILFITLQLAPRKNTHKVLIE